MKRSLLILAVIAALLVACNQSATPTVTDAEMATKVALILTNMPTATSQSPKTASATPGLPTVAVTAAPKTPEPTKAAATVGAATGTPVISPTVPAATKPVSSVTVLPATPTGTAATKAASATPAAPTATLASGDPKAKLGAPAWSDPMNKGDNWPTGTDPAGYTEVAMKDGFMELTALKPIDGWRLTSERLGNAYLEMTVNSGSCLAKDRYGVIVRVPSAADANRGYLFGFTCDGKYAIRKWDGASNLMTTFVNWKANSAINAGANKVNRLGVALDGAKMSLYANGVLLDSVQDGTWQEGNFGIFAGAHESTQYTLKIDEINTWTLP